jgi:hypothetical protein
MASCSLLVYREGGRSMPKNKRAKQVPERAKEAADPNPDVEPNISEEPKGEPSSRLDASKEPGEDEEKRRVAEKLREREQDS